PAARRRVPRLHRRRLAVVAEDAERGCVEQEILARARREADPAGDEYSQYVTVREEHDVSLDRADPGDDPVGAGRDLARRFARRAAVAENHPPRSLRLNLRRRAPFVFAVIPLA